MRGGFASRHGRSPVARLTRRCARILIPACPQYLFQSRGELCRIDARPRPQCDGPPVGGPHQRRREPSAAPRHGAALLLVRTSFACPTRPPSRLPLILEYVTLSCVDLPIVSSRA